MWVDENETMLVDIDNTLFVDDNESMLVEFNDKPYPSQTEG